MKRNIFIAGFPEAGKTTFLASIFHLLDSNRNQRKGFYVERPSDTSYIDAVIARWVSVEEQERTRLNEITPLSFKILKEGLTELDLTVPDISGEIFREILKDRKIDKPVADKIINSDTIILFIHPLKIINTRRADSVKAQAQALGERSENQNTEETTAEDFDYLNAATQVHIVDLFQTFRKLNESSNIGIIISAWDLMKDSFNEPKAYIQENLPLLSQFLETYERNVVFGLSANGGNISEAKEKAKLEDMEPEERVTFYINDEAHTGYQRFVEWLVNEK